MTGDWAAVAEAINTRMDELGMTQQDLSVTSGVSTATLRELQHNRNPRRRSSRLLEAVARALHWPAGHLGRVLEEGKAVTAEALAAPELRREVERLRQDVTELKTRMDAFEREH